MGQSWLRRSFRRLGAGAAGVAIVATALAIPSARSAAASGFEEVGRVPVPKDPDSTTVLRGGLILDPVSDRGFRIFRDADTFGLAIWSFSLDGLKELKRTLVADFPTAPEQKFGYVAVAGGGRLYVIDELGWMHVFDQVTLERVGYWPSILPVPSGSTVQVARREQTRGQQRLTAEGRRTPAAPYAALPGHRIVALSYLPPGKGNEAGGKILTLSHAYINEADSPQSIVTLHRWDAKTGQEDWTAQLNGCRTGRSFGNTTRWSTGLSVRTKADGSREAIIGCVGRGLVGEVWQLDLTPTGTVGTQTLLGQVATASDFLMDPEGRRAHAITSSGVGQSVVAVDLERKGVIGSVNLSFDFEAQSTPQGVGAGIDPLTGRIYALAAPSRQPTTGKTNPGGIIVIDGRRAPLPQGFAFTDQASPALDMVSVAPARDGRPTLIFVHRQGEPFYRVFADRIPLQGDPPLVEADRFTVDAAEQDGVTQASYSGAGNGYGLRVILLGGTNAIPDPVTAVRGESLTKDMVTGFGTSPGCGETNREVVFATVKTGTSLSDTGSTADAAAATADPRTIQDLEQPVASCSPSLAPRTTFGRSRTHPDDVAQQQAGQSPFRDTKVPGSNDNVDQFIGPSFPFSPAVCLPPDKPTDESPHDGDQAYQGVKPPSGWTAKVECPTDQPKVTARAASAGASFGDVSIGKATNETTIERKLGEGTSVKVVSEVRGFSIGSDLSIARIQSVATSIAGGRPKSAKTTFTTKLCGVSVASISVEQCFDPRSADMKNVIGAINTALAQRQMELRLPDPDGDLRKGTPGGALAAIAKDRFASQGDRLFNNDFSAAVPAIELLRLHDSTQGRGRQIVQLAGVQAASSYNISLVPTGQEGEDPGDGLLNPVGELGETAIGDLPIPSIPEVFKPDFPSIAELLTAIVRTIGFAFREPGAALSVTALAFAAFGLPLHLFERRRLLAAARSRRP